MSLDDTTAVVYLRKRRQDRLLNRKQTMKSAAERIAEITLQTQMMIPAPRRRKNLDYPDINHGDMANPYSKMAATLAVYELEFEGNMLLSRLLLGYWCIVYYSINVKRCWSPRPAHIIR